MSKSKEKDLNYRFFINHFATYGLNRHRSFLQRPKSEDLAYIATENKDDLGELCASLLFEHDCPESAIFCVCRDGSFITALKLDEETPGKISIIESRDPYSFSYIDAEYRLCCYGLMIEVDDNKWEVCE